MQTQQVRSAAPQLDPRARRAPIEHVVAGFATALLGLSAGAMLAEAAVLVPFWRAQAPDAFLRWYADNAALLLDFYAPLEIVAAVVAIAAALLGTLRQQPWRGPLIAAALLAIAVLLAFPLYFQAVNASFERCTIAIDQVADELGRWARWHWARTCIGIGAFVSALWGFGRRATARL